MGKNKISYVCVLEAIYFHPNSLLAIFTRLSGFSTNNNCESAQRVDLPESVIL